MFVRLIASCLHLTGDVGRMLPVPLLDFFFFHKIKTCTDQPFCSRCPTSQRKNRLLLLLLRRRRFSRMKVFLRCGS